MLKNVQYGLGFLIGFFAAMIAGIGLIVSIESLTGEAVPYKVPLALLLSVAVGVAVARWIGSFDLSRFITAREPAPKPAAAQPKRPRKRRPWSFHLIGTLILFWFLSLVAIIVLFGPFGFADDPRTGIRLLKMLVTTVAITGLGAFLLRKELTKLMSPSKK